MPRLRSLPAAMSLIGLSTALTWILLTSGPGPSPKEAEAPAALATFGDQQDPSPSLTSIARWNDHSAAPGTQTRALAQADSDSSKSAMTGSGTLEVRVTASGAVVARAMVRVRRGLTHVAQLRTDAKGIARFEEIELGSYRITAELEPLLRDEKLIDFADSDVPVELQLPPYGSLQGIVLAPPGARLDAVLIQVDPDPWPANSDHGAAIFNDILPRARVGQDGSFSISRIPAGPVTVRVILPRKRVVTDTGAAHTSRAPRVIENQLEVPPTATAFVEFDVRARFPGYLAVEVPSVPPGPLLLSLEQGELSYRANLDTGRETILGPLLPGLWTGSIGPVGGWKTPVHPVDVPPAGTGHISIHWDLLDRDVAVYSSRSLKPLRRSRICLRNSYGMFIARTDENGTLSLTIPRGRYTLYRPGPGSPTKEEVAAVNWLDSTPTSVAIPERVPRAGQ